MNYLTQTINQHICTLTLSRPNKSNAFDEVLIQELTQTLNQAISNETVRVIILKGEGKHFSAGADLNWMKRMAKASQADNEKDALHFAKLLHTLYHCPKPTLAQVHGATYGGGIGLMAACDIAIAETATQFCFPEVKLGLIPAVISPYVIESIGSKMSKRLFITAEPFDTPLALKINLIHETIESSKLNTYVFELAIRITQLPPTSTKACKILVDNVASHPIDEQLMQFTAKQIAKQRQSSEAQKLIHEFLSTHHATR